MSYSSRSSPEWAIAGLLAALVATNTAFAILQRTGGPVIGTAFYLVLLAVAWCRRQRARHLLILGGLVGLTVHAGEVITIGWSAQPVLMAMNLALPTALTLVAWTMDQRLHRAADRTQVNE